MVGKMPTIMVTQMIKMINLINVKFGGQGCPPYGFYSNLQFL